MSKVSWWQYDCVIADSAATQHATRADRIWKSTLPILRRRCYKLVSFFCAFFGAVTLGVLIVGVFIWCRTLNELIRASRFYGTKNKADHACNAACCMVRKHKAVHYNILCSREQHQFYFFICYMVIFILSWGCTRTWITRDSEAVTFQAK